MIDQPTVTLNDGRVMPQFGLGVWQTPADAAATVVKSAVGSGYRLIDTAAIYGNERGVGEALKDAPDVFLTTKLWNDKQGYDAARGAFDRTLERLGRDSVDLYLIHWPAPAKGLYVETWKALVALRDEGRAKSIGVSNFTAEHLRRVADATGVMPSVNQIELHPGFQQTELRAFHEANGIRTESWSPLGQGKLLTDPRIGAIGRRHGKTAAQAIIRWHLDSGLIVIPKSVTPARIAQNIDVFDFTLEEGDMQVFRALDRTDGRIGPDPMTADF